MVTPGLARRARSSISLSPYLLKYVVPCWIVFVICYSTADSQARNRIAGIINTNQTVQLPGSTHPLARSTIDIGPIAGDTRLAGITIYFQLTAQQKAELDALVKAQQTSGSGSYHKWLTPAEYGSRFGLSESDLAKVKTWLESGGFTVDRVSSAHNSITFSGTVSQVNAAFHTEIHSYRVGSQTHFANATELSIPQAFAGVIESIRNLNDFRPRPFVRFHKPRAGAAKPAFTSGQSGDHYLQPGDVSVIYDVSAAYNAGYTGTGQSIAVVGQSEIDLSDIENFERASGLSIKDPTLVLVPDSGTPQFSSGDQAESSLDVEYSGAIAKEATIYLVYTGNNPNYGAFDSLQYAVDTDIAPIISMSYGACEPDLSSSDYSTLESIMEQAASQGQSVIVASGDTGSTACYANLTTNSIPTNEEEELAVDYPASSAYVTALGGTEFPAADVASSDTTYWESATGNDVVTSAKSYIPEQVWNDDSSSVGSQYGAEYAIAAGGGGVSALTPRPSWQNGVAGIPSGNYRLVPDISLDSSPANAGYLYCTGDTSAWTQGQQASCNDGFRDSSTGYLTVAGGTSFAAPIFAGMLALINQKENSTGQGLINSTLYTLAANSSTYSSAFHDITSGGNECSAGSSYCSSAGEAKYHAGTGYDEASGLGSVDLNDLMGAWTPGSSSSLDPTTTSLAAATSTPASGANDTITITVAPDSSSISTTPTGSMTVEVDGTQVASSLALSNGSASYTFSSTVSGDHVIKATYSGDSTFASSTGSVTVDVAGSSGSSSPGTFTLSATDVNVAQGSSGTSTITVTSKNSYAGTVEFTLSSSSTSLMDYGCYGVPDASVSANGTATTTLTIYTSKSDCTSASWVKGAGRRRFGGANLRTSETSVSQEKSSSRERIPIEFAAVFAGFLFLGIRKRRIKIWAALVCLGLSGILWMPIGCGGSPNSGSTANDVAKGSYTLTLDGVDSASSSIAASTTLSLTVD